MSEREKWHLLAREEIDRVIPFRKEVAKQKSSNIHENVAKKYLQLCVEESTTPDLLGYSSIATGYKSKSGNYLEIAFSKIANAILQDTGKHFRGKEVEAEVLKHRKELSLVRGSLETEEYRALLDASMQVLQGSYFLNREWVEKMLTPLPLEMQASTRSKDIFHSISLPDSITIFKPEDGITRIRIGEAKVSGELDSKNLPKNIDELMSVGPYDNISSSKVERAILLTGTSMRNGNYPIASRWKNEISRRGIELPVYCNENSLAWASNSEISWEEYHQGILVPLEDVLASRIFKQLHE